MALVVHVCDIDVLRVGGVRFAGQAHGVAGECREGITVPGQANQCLARQACAGRAVQEAHNDRQRKRAAGQERTRHWPEVDRQSVGHKGIDPEIGRGDRIGVRIGTELNRPVADSSTGGQHDRHADSILRQARRCRLHKDLSIGTSDGDAGWEIDRTAGVVAQDRHGAKQRRVVLVLPELVRCEQVALRQIELRTWIGGRRGADVDARCEVPDVTLRGRGRALRAARVARVPRGPESQADD